MMRTTWCSLRTGPTWLVPLALAAVLIFLPQLGADYAFTRQVQLMCLLALVASGLNLSYGYGGLLAFGQVAMYAAGAYTAGILATHGHTDILVQIVAAGGVALVIGLATGIPGLRLGGWSLAMTSFFLVLMIPDVVVMLGDTGGGRNGLSGIPTPTILGRTIELDQIYPLIVLVTIVWFVLFRNLVISRHGVAFRVLKQSPVLAASSGMAVARTKLTCYAMGAVPAGLAGALFANLDGYVSPAAFTFTAATAVLASSVLGGAASVYGAVAGAAVIQFGPNRASEFMEYTPIVYGALLVIGGVLLSGGLAGLCQRFVTRVDRWAGVDLYRGLGTGADRTPAPTGPGVSLSVSDLSKSFGGNKALDAVGFEARPGEVTALIGPNGSGKTTLLNMVSGFYRPDRGTILLGERDVTHTGSHRVARLGVARTFQTPNIPTGVSVVEAVTAGRYSAEGAGLIGLLGSMFRTPGFRRTARRDREAALDALARVGLLELAGHEAAALPLGTRRLLELARALASSPTVLLLDEVASGLDEDEVARLSQIITSISKDGLTVVLVEHNFRLVTSIADRIVVLARGQIIADDVASVVATNERVLNEYLGGAAESSDPAAGADLTVTTSNGAEG